jgi:hypothetical protein
MSTSDEAGKVVEVLREGPDEIGKLHALVNRRVVALTEPWQPLSASIGELADFIGIAPHEALDEVIASGVRDFWHEGTRFRTADDLKQYLARGHFFDPVPEIEIDLSADQVKGLAVQWELDVEREADADSSSAVSETVKPMRKFIASEADLPTTAANRPRQNSG